MRSSRLVVAIASAILFLPNPAVADGASPYVSVHYDDQHSMTIVYAQEKLIDATTSLGASYGFPGHFLKTYPDTISITLFGYHNDVEWKEITTLNIRYDSGVYANKVHYTLHGGERDKSADVVNSTYFETLMVEVPLETAKDIFKSHSVTITSTPTAVDASITSDYTDRCSDLLGSIDFLRKMKPTADSIADSKDGLPLKKQIDGSSGSVALSTSTVQISPQFWLLAMTFNTISGHKVAAPTSAILLTELDDDPALQTTKTITLRYGKTTLALTSDLYNIWNVDTSGQEAIRRYPITYHQFHRLAESASFTLEVDGKPFVIPSDKLKGFHSLASHTR